MPRHWRRQEIHPGVPILVYLDPEDLSFQRKRLGAPQSVTKCRRC